MKTKFNVAAGLDQLIRAAVLLVSWAAFAENAQAQAPVYQVDSIASLRLVTSTGLSGVHQVIVAGYNAPRDGGGGFYTVDAGDMSSIDNGGTIIVATTDNARWKLTQSEAPTAMQFGAVYGDDGVHDNAPKIQNALNACSVVRLPVGIYRCSSPIVLKSGNVLVGMGASGAVDSPAATDAAKLIFYGTGNACITSSSTGSLHEAGVKNLAVEVDGSSNYSWIVQFTGPVGLAFENVHLGADNTMTGGIKCNAQSPGSGVSDRNHFLRTVVNLPSNQSGGPPPSPVATLDVDFTDSELISCEFVGGAGAFFRGSGQVNCLNDRFAQSFRNNVTLVRDQRNSGNAVGFSSCSFEQSTAGEIFVSDSNDSFLFPRFVDNTFSNSIYTGSVIATASPYLALPGVVDGNNMITAATTPFSLNPSGASWTLADDKYTTLPDFSALPDAKLDEDIEVFPLRPTSQVMGQSGHASSTTNPAETMLASIPIPANTLGIAGKLRISATFSSTTANAKVAFIRFGNALTGTAFHQETISGTTTNSRVLCEICMTGTATSEMSAQSLASTGVGLTGGTTPVLGSVDTTVNESVVLSGKTASGDPLTLEQYTVEVLRP